MFIPYLSVFHQVRAVEPGCHGHSSQVAKDGIYVREDHISRTEAWGKILLALAN